MADLRPNLSLANKLVASRAAGAPGLASPADAAVLQSVVNHSVDLAALKSELEKVRAELAAHKAKLADLEQCILNLDHSLETLQKENLQGLVEKVSVQADRLQGVAEVQSALADRVSKVETLHSKLSGVFSG